MERGSGGAIINVSSQASQVALQDHLVYCSSKGAVDQATRCMALELGKHQVGCFQTQSDINKESFVFVSQNFNLLLFPNITFLLLQQVKSLTQTLAIAIYDNVAATEWVTYSSIVTASMNHKKICR